MSQPTPQALSVRAVLFDAVGTLLRPRVGVAEAYRRAAAPRGSRLSAKEIARRFVSVREEEERRDLHEQAGRTDEGRERARWRRIVVRVLDDVADVEGVLAELWDFFGRPSAWQPIPEAARAARAIAGAGYQVGWASNFDERLPRIVAELPELNALGPVFVSSQLGYRKPHLGFFRAIEAQLRLPPGELLLVGDEQANDYEAARQAGWQAQLVPVGETPERARFYQELLKSLGVDHAGVL